MSREELLRLSKEELIELVLRLQGPEKTSRTSSKPPSTDRKASTKGERGGKPGGAKPGHEGHSRKLSENPDAFEDHAPTRCSRCGLPFGEDAQRELIGEYDEIEIAPVKPFVRRHRRWAMRCSCCATQTRAPAPPAAAGTPFGPRLHGLVVYLKGLQLFSFQRLREAVRDLFGLEISEGALTNMLARAAPAFQARREQALAALRQARFVASDETGSRVNGKTAWHWVFRCRDAVVHTAADTRGVVVVQEAMAGHRPHVWSSDRYGAQQGHADRHQTCLAHLRRDARWLEERSDDYAGLRLRLWFGRVFELARGARSLAPSTIAAKRRGLERDIDDILASPADCPLAREVIAKIARARDQLLTFLDYPDEVEPTNNDCERDVRPFVIARKVSNGFRSDWGAEHDAALRTAVDTARLAGARPFRTILETLAEI